MSDPLYVLGVGLPFLWVLASVPRQGLAECLILWPGPSLSLDQGTHFT